MPCNAVAVVKAMVSQEVFSQALSKDLLRQIIGLVSDQTGINVVRNDYSLNNRVSDIRLPDGITLQIWIIEGKIVLKTERDRESALSKQFETALKAKIQSVGAALLAKQVANILKNQGAQNFQTSYKNGKTVLTFQA